METGIQNGASSLGGHSLHCKTEADGTREFSYSEDRGGIRAPFLGSCELRCTYKHWLLWASCLLLQYHNCLYKHSKALASAEFSALLALLQPLFHLVFPTIMGVGQLRVWLGKQAQPGPPSRNPCGTHPLTTNTQKTCT